MTAMTGRKNHALQVPTVVPYKASGKFLNSLYGTTGGTCSTRFFPFCHERSCCSVDFSFKMALQIFFKVFMTQKIISAHLRGLSKYRRMTFFFSNIFLYFRDMDIFLLFK